MGPIGTVRQVGELQRSRALPGRPRSGNFRGPGSIRPNQFSGSEMAFIGAIAVIPGPSGAPSLGDKMNLKGSAYRSSPAVESNSPDASPSSPSLSAPSPRYQTYKAAP
jgi:hypothetical protein